MSAAALSQSGSFLSPEVLLGAVAGFTVAVFFALIVLLTRSERGRTETSMQLARVAETADRLALTQAQLAGRFAEGQSGVGERLDILSHRLADGLVLQTERTQSELRLLHERLAVIDAAGRTLGQLAAQVGSLQELLANKQARGAFGEVQLRDLVTAVLPPAACAFQVTLGNGMRADCLVRLPDPPGPIVIDAKFPLESYRALRAAADEAGRSRAARGFAQDVQRHVRDIASKYILPGETADSALMFLPSEAIYAELHAHFAAVVEEAFRMKVWIVSPTTLWATLHTLSGVLRDVRLREQAGAIQVELRALVDDLGRLAQRVGNLQRHFAQAQDDVREISVSCDKASTRAARIDLSQLAAEQEATPAPARPAPSAFDS
jgi:Uncharacterized protein conserved in bacteria